MIQQDMETIAIEANACGGFKVRVTRVDGNDYVIDHSASRATARDWIDKRWMRR